MVVEDLNTVEENGVLVRNGVLKEGSSFFSLRVIFCEFYPGKDVQL